MFYCVLVERIVAIVIHDGHIYIRYKIWKYSSDTMI